MSTLIHKTQVLHPETVSPNPSVNPPRARRASGKAARFFKQGMLKLFTNPFAGGADSRRSRPDASFVAPAPRPSSKVTSGYSSYLNRFVIQACVVVVCGLAAVNAAWANTIASQGFETSGDTWTFSSSGGAASATAGTSDTPANSRILAGSQSWQVNNASSTLTFNPVTTSGYSSIGVTVRLSSTSGNASNGSDAADTVKVFVALNGAAFSATPDITLAGNNNARWAYSATLTQSTAAGTAVSIAAPQGGTSANNYSTLTVTVPNGTTSVALKIAALNNDPNEIWNFDSITLTGTPVTTPAITLGDNGTQVAAANVQQGTTSVVLHQSQLAVTTANATLNSVTFTSAGTYVASDVSNFKIWYNTSSSFSGATSLGTISTSLGAGSHTLPGLTQSINSGTTGYIFITTDVASGATVGNTVSVNALTTANLTFASGNVSGSTTAGGAQTITAANTPKITLKLPGQSSANTGSPTAQTAGSAFTVTVTATTDGTTPNANYNGLHTINFSTSTGSSITSSSPSVNFSGGVGSVNVTLTKAEALAITATDGTIAGFPSSSLTISAGAATWMIVTLPGETFTSGSGNSGTATSQKFGVAFNIVQLSAVDAYNNVDLNYSGSKTIGYTGPSGSPSYTTAVNFTAGQSTTTLTTTLPVAETTSITASDGSLTGVASSSLLVRGTTTYTWIGSGSTPWTTAANWSPSRTTPDTDDILVFSGGGSSTATAVPAQTIGKLQISGNTTITLQAGAANTLTISGGASALSVASGSALNVSGSTALTINLPTGSSGSISGAMDFAGGAHRLTAVDPSGITFQNGATFTADTGFTGNVFGGGTTSSVIFANGSTYVSKAGSNPFNTTAGVVTFQTGSLYSHQQTGAPSFSGRTYGNVEINAVGFNVSSIGANALSIDNFTIIVGTLNLNLTAAGISIKGNVSVANGQTLAFNPASAETVTFNGSSAQTISGSGTLSFGANSAITIASSSTVNLQNNITTVSGTTLIVNGVLAGTGAVSGNGSVTVSSTGTLSPGNGSIATLAFGNSLSLAGTAAMAINKSTATPAILTADQAAVTGTLTYGGTLTVTTNGPVLASGDSFTLFTAGTFSGWFSTVTLPTLASGLTWDTNDLATTGILDVYAFTTNAVQTMSAAKNTTTGLLIAKLLSKTSGSRGTLGLSSVSTSTSGASVVINGSYINYTPATGYTGPDTFTAVLSDGHGSITATVYVTVVDPSNPILTGNGSNLTIVDNGGGNVRLIISGTSGVNYQLQYSSDLTTWNNLGTAFAMPSVGLTNILDTIPSGSRYYRTLLP